MMNLFLERTIENWLTKTNELGFQLAFCQSLINQGHNVLINSVQNIHEQGKDVVSIDSSGNQHAYQLKGGKITLTRWQDEVKTSVEELIAYTINHPNIDKTKPVSFYLVTNGDFDPTVIARIENLNLGRWKDTPLKVKNYQGLLVDFLAISNNFLPKKLEDYKNFLDLVFAEGKELPNIHKYSSLLESILITEKASLEEKKRSIDLAVLYTSYTIGNFYEAKNYTSIIRALSILCNYILAVVERFDLDQKYWKNSFDLVWQEINNAAEFLEEEIMNNGFNNMIGDWWDGTFAIFRRHLACETLLAVKLGRYLKGETETKSVSVTEFIGRYKSSVTIWGEPAFYSNILVFWYLKTISPSSAMGEITSFLKQSLNQIVSQNGRKSIRGLLSPYYSITTAIHEFIGLLEQPIKETFIRRSFLVKSIIELLTVYREKDFLKEKWREITYIRQESFVPAELWHNFLWRVGYEKGGKNTSEVPKKTEAWNELVKQADLVNISIIPKVLQSLPHFFPLFLLIFPHRINNHFIKYINKKIDSQETK